MASSNIKLFDENKGNMLSDSEFNISNQRMNGLQTGVASSQLQNKAMYQASLVAYAIAQIMMQNGLNANDTDAVSAFVANLSGTMLQKVYDVATTAEAQAGVATGKWMSPALVKAAINYMKATTAEAQAGTDDTKWMSPALVKAAIDKTLTDKNYLQKSGGTMTGNLILNANPTANLGAATKQYVDSAKNACLLKSGGTMTGNLILNANPTANLGAATKQYVDTQVNNVKTALTPVFGDLSKDGWYKLGEFVNNGKDIYVYGGAYSFLSNIVDKLTELALVLKNVNLVNTGSSAIKLFVYNRSGMTSDAGVHIYTATASATSVLNRIAKMSLFYTTASSLYFGDSYENFSISDSNTDLYVVPRNGYLAITSGTIELWYR